LSIASTQTNNHHAADGRERRTLFYTTILIYLTSANRGDDSNLIARLDGPRVILIHVLHIDGKHRYLEDRGQVRMPCEQEFRECFSIDVVGPFKLVAVGLGGVLC
jgi:hypothetical protein